MLDEKLKELQQLPENERVKQRVRQGLIERPKKKKDRKPFAAAIAFCAVLLLFLTTSPQLMTSSAKETIIYTYFDAKADTTSFKAHPSLLYTGMQVIDSEEAAHYLANVTQLPVVSDGILSNYVVDVIFMEAGEEHRYKVSDTTIYDVKQKVFYSDTSEAYENIFHILYEPSTATFTIFFPLAVMLLNVAGSIYYKRLKINPNDSMPKTLSFYVMMTLIMVTLFGGIFYSIFIGPFYKPLSIILGLPFLLFLWRYYKQFIFDYRVLRFERVRLFLSYIIIILAVFISF